MGFGYILNPNRVYTPSLSLIALKMLPQLPPKYSRLPPEIPPGGGGELGVFDFKNKNSHPNKVYTPSLSLIALKM